MYAQIMYAQIKFPRKWIRLVILMTFNGSLILGSTPVFSAPIPLTQATLRKVVNRVDLLLRSQPVRSAQVNDRLSSSGDSVKTQRASRTELKFNDGTLAKVGELANFRFTPNTRRFELGNGTYLFLVPPGRGNTEFNTPNAKAGVKGSALFIRYIEESDTTIMGALTNNPLGPMDITVGGKKQDLYAGQMVFAIKDRIDRIETFDLTTFLRTSPMYRDIDLTDPDLKAVRQEMADAVVTQVAAIGILPANVATMSTPGISSDPTSSVSRRELNEARESLNNPSRSQPIAQLAPPNVKDSIVKPDPKNLIDTKPIPTPVILTTTPPATPPATTAPATTATPPPATTATPPAITPPAITPPVPAITPPVPAITPPEPAITQP
ncbi:MAG: FecR domain-containing protein, partial [Alkalinema sp. CAN_BIN05]|nr:FecR domain-containing protein [Alkalinema sp. CAN_BIN05]